MSAPWENETVPASFEAHGLQCLVLRGPMGALCGYVKLPHAHPLYGVDYSQTAPDALKLAAEAVLAGPIGKRGAIDVLLMAMGDKEMRAGVLFDVHGGITFSGCPYSADGPEQEGFWYGFDCSHAGDITPSSWDRYPEFRHGDEIYRDVAYVTAECESLARQLSQLQALTS